MITEDATKKADIDAAKARPVAFKNDSGRTDILNRFKTASPAQIRTYITNNSATLAQLREIVILLALAVALDDRD